MSTTMSTPARAQSEGSSAVEQVQEKVQEARGVVRRTIGDQVETRSTDAGTQLSQVAEALRKTTESLKEEGQEGPARILEQVATRTDGIGSYLTDAKADAIVRDAENFGRRRPWAVIAGGVALGIVGARFLKASSSRRFEELQGAQRWRPQPLPQGSVHSGGTSAEVRFDGETHVSQGS